jgi:hypothetical protein
MENPSSNRGRHIALRPIRRVWDSAHRKHYSRRAEGRRPSAICDVATERKLKRSRASTPRETSLVCIVPTTFYQEVPAQTATTETGGETGGLDSDSLHHCGNGAAFGLCGQQKRDHDPARSQHPAGKRRGRRRESNGRPEVRGCARLAIDALAQGAVANHHQITSRARPANAFWAPRWAILLAPQTAAALVGADVTAGLRDSGYRVLEPNDPGYASAAKVNVRIVEFWPRTAALKQD